MKKPPIPAPLSKYLIEHCTQYGTLIAYRYTYGDMCAFGEYVAECAYAFYSNTVVLSEIINDEPKTVQKFIK